MYKQIQRAAFYTRQLGINPKIKIPLFLKEAGILFVKDL